MGVLLCLILLIRHSLLLTVAQYFPGGLSDRLIHMSCSLVVGNMADSSALMPVLGMATMCICQTPIMSSGSVSMHYLALVNGACSVGHGASAQYEQTWGTLW